MTYVVHLEDDETLQEILKVAFQATDPKVNLKQFINGDDVAAHIKPNVESIDLYVLDIRVPGSIDGLGVARKIREYGSDAPIIMTSAYRAPDREIIDSLSLEWMSKPWHIMEISQRLITIAKAQRLKATKAAVAGPSPTATLIPPSTSVVPPQQQAPAPAAQVVPPTPPTVTPPTPTVELEAPIATAQPAAPPVTASAPQAAQSPLTPTIKPRLTSAPPTPPETPSGED
jgi:DNA-binding NarL/FixJ family response regulator